MRVIVDFLKAAFITLWVVLAIIATICLLQTNKYGVSEFGDYALFVIDTKEIPAYKKNDIVITKKLLESEYKEGDLLFFYYGNKDTRSYINMGEVTKIQVNKNAEDTFYFDEQAIAYGNLIGNADKTLVTHNLGIVLNILESKWGFMFLVILPTIYLIVYEIANIIKEIKKEMKKDLANE